MDKFDLPMNSSFFSLWNQKSLSNRPLLGELITSHYFVNHPAEKFFLQKKINVSAVDMETFFAVKICSDKSIPILIVRIIIDSFSDRLLDISTYLEKEEKILTDKYTTIKKIMTETIVDFIL